MNEKKEDLQKEDNDLVKMFCDGDERSFNILVLKYRNKIISLCYRYLGNYDDANDMAQDVFVAVYKSIDKFRYGSKFSTWLYTITVNRCKNRLGSLMFRIKRKTFSIDKSIVTENGSYNIEIEDNTLSPNVVLKRKEKIGLIQKAINSLKEEQKTVVILRDIEGLSYDEISQITGLNIGTVRSKLARARGKLQEKLRGVLEYEV